MLEGPEGLVVQGRGSRRDGVVPKTTPTSEDACTFGVPRTTPGPMIRQKDLELPVVLMATASRTEGLGHTQTAI